MMNVLWDDLVNEVVYQVQDRVVPAYQQWSQQRQSPEFLRAPRPPPTTTDLVYVVMDRFLASSAPAQAWPTPSYTDVGRDVTRPWRSNDDSDNGEEDDDDDENDNAEGTHSGEVATVAKVPSAMQAQNDAEVNDTSPTWESAFLRGIDEELSQVPEALSMDEHSKADTIHTEVVAGESSSSVLPPATENPQDGGMSSASALEKVRTSPSAVAVNDHYTHGNGESSTPATNDDDDVSSPKSSQPSPSPSPVIPSPSNSPDLVSSEQSSAIGPTPVENGETSVEQPETSGATSSDVPQKDPQGAETNDPPSFMPMPISPGDEIPPVDPIEHTNNCSQPASPTSPKGEEKDAPTLASTPGDDTTIEASSDNPEVDERDETANERSSGPMQGELEEGTDGSSLKPEATPNATPQHPPPPASALRNSPATIATYLEKRHGRNHFLAFSLTDERPDDRTLLLFRRQIVQLGWWSPCTERSEAPSIAQLLKICYAIHAYLQLDPNHVALVYCANGKTRTAIVTACYLKFAGFCATSREGFLRFLVQRGMDEPTKIWEQLPPSLHLFFEQFDTALSLGGFLNRKPLLLRAIALQGIPVEDKPCLDIWDSSQRHVYTSHPKIMWQQTQQDENEAQSKPNQRLSQWADEEGFYRVNAVLDGDFLLLCRFGGDFAEDATIHDPSKILFRYTNTTGFLSGGYPYELTPDRVDLSRRYAPHLDDEDFLVTLLFEANWERLDDEAGDEGEHVLPKSVMEQLGANSSAATERIYRSYEPEACEEGLRLIVQNHSARPNREDIRDFKKLHGDKLDDCKDHLICITLQLTNFESQRAVHLLLESPSFSWWKSRDLQPAETPETGPKWKRNKSKAKARPFREEAAVSKEILSLLDEVDMESGLDGPDRLHLQQAQESLLIAANTSVMATTSQPSPPSYLRSSGWMVPSLMYPRRGEIMESFSEHYEQFHQRTARRFKSDPPSYIATTRPRLPCFPRSAPALIPPPLPKRQRRDKPTFSLEFARRNTTQEKAWQLQRNLNHTQIGVKDLAELMNVSHTWTDKTLVSDDESDDEEELAEEDGPMSTVREASMNREAKEQQQKKWEDAQKAEAKEKEKQLAEAVRKKEEEEAKRNQENSGIPQSSDEVALEKDPEYSKYFKMLKMGMPKEQVLHAMTRDEKDLSILNLDPNKSLKSQQPVKSDGEVPLNEDPEYSKYFKMLKMGLPMGAVKNSLTRDGKDPSVMDLDPKKSLKSQSKLGAVEDDGVPLKDDPEYSKYLKMLRMGLPVGAVKNALTKDGKDPGIIDLNPEKSLRSQTAGSEAGDDGPSLKEDPEYSKYFKMLSMGLPIGAVKNALTRDGKDPAIMDLDPNRSVKSQLAVESDDADPGTPLKDDPEYAKYFKMLSMGLPIGAVKNALSRDGKDPSVMDLDPTKSVKSQLGGGAEEDTGVPLQDDLEYSKYFKMLAMGLPAGAVQNALERDGKNPAVLDMDPTKSISSQMKMSSGSKKPVKKKKRVRRKKIYWNPIDPSKLKEDSMWNIVRGSVAMDKLKYDEKEFEDLFTESTDPSNQKNQTKDTTKEKKKLVQVIDPKRSMNGGIVLARLKTEHSKIAEFVNRMKNGKFDSTQLKALKEYLPDADERRGLVTYMKKGESSPEIREKLYADCSETEKYMVTMIDVPDASAKLDVMLFRTIFKNQFDEATDGIRTLNKACDELRSSEKLRKLMAMILTVVNQINTGGEGKMAMGFTLDALLKLNEAKAFDKKTSVLHYVVKLVKKNDEALLDFERDIQSVIPAESVLLDGLNNDVKSISEELTAIHETVRQEADRMEKAGELRPMSLTDLAEQKTAVHVSGGIAQFNKMDHLTGRTSMERFTLTAKVACEKATESIENIKKKYRAVLQYFGEDEQMATADFFGTLRRFIAEWKKAVEQVEAIEKKETKEKKRASAKAAKAKRSSGGGPKKQNSSVSGKSPNVCSREAMARPGAKLQEGSAAGAARITITKNWRENSSTDSNLTLASAVRQGDVSGTEKEDKFGAAGSGEPGDMVDLPVSFDKGKSGEQPPVGISEPEGRSNYNGASSSNPDFATKAAAHRRQKEKKDGSDDPKSDFFSAASAYRRKTSERDLGSDENSKVSTCGIKAQGSNDSHGTPGGTPTLVRNPTDVTMQNSKPKETYPGVTSSQKSDVFDADCDQEDEKAVSNPCVSQQQDLEDEHESVPQKPSANQHASAMDPNGKQRDLAFQGVLNEPSVHNLSTAQDDAAKDDGEEPSLTTRTREKDAGSDQSPIAATNSLPDPGQHDAADAFAADKVEATSVHTEKSSGQDIMSLEVHETFTGDKYIKEVAGSSNVGGTDSVETALVSKLADPGQQKIEEHAGAASTSTAMPHPQAIKATSIRPPSASLLSPPSIDGPTQSTAPTTYESDRQHSPSSHGSIVERPSNAELEDSPPRAASDGLTQSMATTTNDSGPQHSPLSHGSIMERRSNAGLEDSPLRAASDGQTQAKEPTTYESDRQHSPLSHASFVERRSKTKITGSTAEKTSPVVISSSAYHLAQEDIKMGTAPLLTAGNLSDADIVEPVTSADHSDGGGADRNFDERSLTPNEIAASKGAGGDIEQNLAALEQPDDEEFHDSSSHDLWNESQACTDSQAKAESKPVRSKVSLSQFLSSNRSSAAPPRVLSLGNSPGLDNFFDAKESENISPELEDSSVAIMANSLQRGDLSSRLSDAWVQGDTIQNFLGWADQAIKSSDSESVRNLEMSCDLYETNDFDDESTIATYQDDASVVSWNTPSRSNSYSNFANMSSTCDGDPPFDVSEKPTVTPAQFAASILFTDSPVNSTELTPAASNLAQSTEQDIIDMGLSIPTNDFGLDTGLSFAVDDAGLDDGLGFGDNGMTYGNDESFTGGLGNLSFPSRADTPKSPEKKSWFLWRN